MLNKLKGMTKNLHAITWIMRVCEVVNRVFPEIFGSARVLTHILYSSSFITLNREQSTFLRGRRDYYRNKHRNCATYVELRRNVHRIEKGRTVRPRRDLIARDYISETIEVFGQAARQRSLAPGTMDQSEVDWELNALFIDCELSSQQYRGELETFELEERAFGHDQLNPEYLMEHLAPLDEARHDVQAKLDPHRSAVKGCSLAQADLIADLARG